MSKSRNLHLFALICNITILAFGIAGICMAEAGFVKSLKYYTVITATVSCIVSIPAILFHIKSIKYKKDCCPKIVYTLRFLAATMALITFIIVVAFLIPTAKNEAARLRLVTDDGLFLHILLPIFSVCCFIFFEIEPKFSFKNCFVPLIVTLIYGVTIIVIVVILNYTQGSSVASSFVPYSFFKLIPGMNGYTPINYAIIFIVLIAAFALAIVVWLLNRMISSLVIGYEVSVNKETTNKESDNKVSAASKTKINKYENNRVYHISIYDHKQKNWKVKLATGEKAIKVFKTQKEAIEYATSLARVNNGSVRVHSRLGRIRKD